MMRAAVIALAMPAVGCKDKPAPRKEEPASEEQRERQKKPPRNTIIIQPDGNELAQALLNVLAAVRADGSLELFPNIFLAGGT